MNDIIIMVNRELYLLDVDIHEYLDELMILNERVELQRGLVEYGVKRSFQIINEYPDDLYEYIDRIVESPRSSYVYIEQIIGSIRLRAIGERLTKVTIYPPEGYYPGYVNIYDEETWFEIILDIYGICIKANEVEKLTAVRSIPSPESNRVEFYAYIFEQEKRGRTLENISNEIAPIIDRTASTIRQGYQKWKKEQGISKKSVKKSV